MQKPPDQKSKKSSAGIAIKILLMVLILPVVIPGYLLGWSMGVQSWMERLGYAIPTYSRNAVCVVSEDVSDYKKELTSSTVGYYGRIPVQDCKEEDLLIDGGDGPDKGKVRWYICWGIDCDETWESSFIETPQNIGPSDVIAFGFAAILLILFIILPVVLTIRLVLGIFSAKFRMGIKARPFLHILGAIFFTLLIFPFFFIEWIQIPADADLIEHFYTHRSKFMQLAEMLRADQQIQYISENQYAPCESLEFERYSLYKDLMNQTQLFGLHSHSGQPRYITFLRKDCYPNAKYVKGHVYLNSEPRALVTSLNDRYRDLPPGSRRYKKIEKNWYIYLEHQSD